MEIPQPPTDPAARRRNHQLMVAGVLCYPVAGLLLLHALDEPGAPLRWVLLGLWVALAGAANVFAWKRYYKRYPPQPWPGSPQRRPDATGHSVPPSAPDRAIPHRPQNRG